MTNYRVDSFGTAFPYRDAPYDSFEAHDVGYFSALNAERETFLTEAIQISLSGIRLGQIAQANGRSEAVRQFGERLAEVYAALN